MYKSEKYTLYYVIGLYLSSTLLLITTLFISYYYYQLQQHETQEIKELKKIAHKVTKRLSKIHENDEFTYKYPRYDDFDTAIYDIDKNLIFSTFDYDSGKLQQEYYTDDLYEYYTSSVQPYYLGAAYMVIRKDIKPINILNNLILIALFVIFIAVITSFFLAKIVLRPMRDTLHLLDNFIKDTTHELNTPITTILANIETIDATACNPKLVKKLERIKIASISISNLYEDLVYLLLNHKKSSKKEELDLYIILKQRVNYFALMAKAKDITLSLNKESEVKFFADKKQFERLIDNIISNAIKYTKVSSTVEITLSKNSIVIVDEGRGMSEEEVKRIFEKYVRFDKVQGGFGIGYSIIKSIAQEYNIDIKIDSKVNIGTKVILSW